MPCDDVMMLGNNLAHGFGALLLVVYEIVLQQQDCQLFLGDFFIVAQQLYITNLIAINVKMELYIIEILDIQFQDLFYEEYLGTDISF